MGIHSQIAIPFGTTFSVTGGTNATFVNEQSGKNGHAILTETSSSPLLRRRLDLQIVKGALPVSVKSSVKYDRSNMKMAVPYTDPDGKIFHLPSMIGMVYHPLMTDAERYAHVILQLEMALAADTRNVLSRMLFS